MNNKIYSVILCGGKGERLWPYSRASKPKQFLSLDGKDTLLKQTINRSKLFAEEIWITSEVSHKYLLGEYSKFVNKTIVEPMGKNTAPAILLSCLELQKEDPNAMVVFLPADHFIQDDGIFANVILQAIFLLDNSKICLLGLKPKFPATGYGYIEAGQIKTGILDVIKFYEKPNLEIAKQYLKDDNKFWNVGVFIGKVATFIAEFKQHIPQIYEDCVAYFSSRDPAGYEAIQSISIDYAVMERSTNIVMFPVDFIWSDIGNLVSFLTFKKTDNLSNVIEINSTDNLIDVPNKLVTLVGMDNVCVVEQDDVLIIVKKDKAEEIRGAISILKKRFEKNLY